MIVLVNVTFKWTIILALMVLL